jgi:protein O-GlcNAc transferase
VSADFRQHVMGRLMADVIGAHDRDRYAVRLYAMPAPHPADVLTERFRALVDRFVLLPHGDLDAARAIAADDCDVLVDLMGHTAFSRPGIYAWKPARRIVTHLGSHGAIGLSQVDFKLTDREADVADAALFQIERPLPMASCVLPFRRAARGTAPGPSRAELGLAGNAVVCGEFVTVHKLSPRCLALWREILARAPAAVLLFSPSGEAEVPSFRRQLAGHGIDPARIAFAPAGTDEATAAARYDVVDLVLDTLPYTGGDTTLAALDAGVPVVTLCGTRHAERMGASILRHAGLPGLVATSERTYVDLAVLLATDAPARARAAAEVRERFAAAAATFPARYTRDLEAALDAAIAAPPPAPA